LVKIALARTFLPALFYADYDVAADPCQQLASLPVKFSGLAMPNPTTSTAANYEVSIVIWSHLLAALQGMDEFRMADHLAVTREVKTELCQSNLEKNNSELTSLANNLSCNVRRTILRCKQTGQWLSVLPSMVNKTKLVAQEFRDALLLHYARSPADLPSHYNICGQVFSIHHALECKKGGLVICRHNKIQDELVDLTSKDLIASAVCDETCIHPSCSTTEAKEPTNDDPLVVARQLRKN
jgi:hypothetical protein